MPKTVGSAENYIELKCKVKVGNSATRKAHPMTDNPVELRFAVYYLFFFDVEKGFLL